MVLVFHVVFCIYYIALRFAWFNVHMFCLNVAIQIMSHGDCPLDSTVFPPYLTKMGYGVLDIYLMSSIYVLQRRRDTKVILTSDDVGVNVFVSFMSLKLFDPSKPNLVCI